MIAARLCCRGIGIWSEYLSSSHQNLINSNDFLKSALNAFCTARLLFASAISARKSRGLEMRRRIIFHATPSIEAGAILIVTPIDLISFNG